MNEGVHSTTLALDFYLPYFIEMSDNPEKPVNPDVDTRKQAKLEQLAKAREKAKQVFEERRKVKDQLKEAKVRQEEAHKKLAEEELKKAQKLEKRAKEVTKKSKEPVRSESPTPELSAPSSSESEEEVEAYSRRERSEAPKRVVKKPAPKKKIVEACRRGSRGRSPLACSSRPKRSVYEEPESESDDDEQEIIVRRKVKPTKEVQKVATQAIKQQLQEMRIQQLYKMMFPQG
jgi:hypothetical protein